MVNGDALVSGGWVVKGALVVDNGDAVVGGGQVVEGAFVVNGDAVVGGSQVVEGALAQRRCCGRRRPSGRGVIVGSRGAVVGRGLGPLWTTELRR